MTQPLGLEKALQFSLKREGEIIKCDLLLVSGKGYPNYNYILTKMVDV